jgi:hypothetical protein
MFTLCKSMVLGAAFFAGAAIAARADPLCRIPIGPRRGRGRQIVARSSASAALAPDSDTPREVNVFGPERAGAAYKVVHVDTRDRWRS